MVEENILQESQICKRCHRKLKDENSRKLGFGKVCYNKYLKKQTIYLFEMEDTNETTIQS